MTDEAPGVSITLMEKRTLAGRSLFVDKERSVWCQRGPESHQGGYWWPFSASGCALYTLWVKLGERALCRQLH